MRTAALAVLLSLPLAAQSSPAFTPELFAVELPCDDVAATARFYQQALGCRVERDTAPASAVLLAGTLRLLLVSTANAAATAAMPFLSLNVRVADLTAATAAVRAAGGTVADATPKAFALGQMVAAADPAGNAVHLLQVTDQPLAAGAPPALFNVSWHAADFAATEAFVAGFGLAVFSRDFLPATLPLQRAGAAPLVFHSGFGQQALGKTTRRPAYCFAVPSLAAAATALAARDVRPLGEATATPLGRALRFAGPDGLGLRVVERGAARLWYERLLAVLPGTWSASSTKGWSATIRFTRMAADSVIVEDDPQGDAANAMLTCIAMDGERILLTHYCHAGNAPRLAAQPATASGDALVFAFVDGGNLSSRNAGHMDELTLAIDSDDRFTGQWQWYQDGKQRPMEVITYVRAK
jgi:predicted enzyme related to lactoylglutathione lyase